MDTQDIGLSGSEWLSVPGRCACANAGRRVASIGLSFNGAHGLNRRMSKRSASLRLRSEIGQLDAFTNAFEGIGHVVDCGRRRVVQFRPYEAGAFARLHVGHGCLAMPGMIEKTDAVLFRIAHHHQREVERPRAIVTPASSLDSRIAHASMDWPGSRWPATSEYCPSRCPVLALWMKRHSSLSFRNKAPALSKRLQSAITRQSRNFTGVIRGINT
ncbi:hypothetical protein LMG27177_04400 [Paraburkholderia fynbosensis]|uniref:Uncharacterized protein n=1 Tax=Paraburkholderia fynbosensis TaxID=1200993 RepID=A0A6J5GD86_9BURK|nr:hypothetical protein LMG27177_04400 [Paraburkholderia fynbosensis]